jgi:hypothetical protein
MIPILMALWDANFGFAVALPGRLAPAAPK